MTKKHFIELADWIRSGNETECPSFTQDQLEYLADFCARTNPRFNRERWLGYIAGTCGPNGGAK